jgi:hypothetical protein
MSDIARTRSQNAARPTRRATRRNSGQVKELVRHVPSDTKGSRSRTVKSQPRSQEDQAIAEAGFKNGMGRTDHGADHGATIPVSKVDPRPDFGLF